MHIVNDRNNPADGARGPAVTRPRDSSGYATFNVPVIDGWMVQCQPTVSVRSSVIVSVEPAGRLVFELPSSSVKVCSVLSLLLTFSVTEPALTSTESGEKAKSSASISALAAPPPPPPVLSGVLAVLVAVLVLVDDDVLLLLVHAAVTKARAARAKTIP